MPSVARCPAWAERASTAAAMVSPAYGYEGGGRMLEEMGVAFGQDLPGPKARIKLMVALGLTSDPAEIRRIFSDSAPVGR